MKSEDIADAAEVVGKLLYCLGLVKSSSAQKNILTAIRTVLNGLDSSEQFYKDIYESKGKIPAIREYRERHSSSLKEAKEAIEKMADEQGWSDPYRDPRII